MSDTLRFGATRLELIEGRPIDYPSEAMFSAANVRGIMASGNAGALRLAAGGDVERELQARAPLLVGRAYVTGAGRLSARGVTRIVHAVVNAQPGEPPKRTSVERALATALDLLSEHGAHSLTLPDVGLRIHHIIVTDAATLLIDALIARLRRGSTLDEVKIVSLEPAYLRACGAAIIERGGSNA